MKRVAFLALILAGLLWGLGFPLGKLILRETDAAHMVLLRFAVAAVVAAPFALRTKEARALFRSPVMLLLGALYGVAFMVQFEGLAHVSVTLAALLVGAMPALIAICAKVMGEKVSRASWMGVGAATLGAALIAGKPDGAGSPLGVALSLGSLFIFLAWLVVLKRAPKPASPMAVPAATVIIAAFTVLPIAFFMHGPPKLDLSPTAWIGVLGLGVLSTLLATAAWQFGSARVGSASAGVFINIEPLMGASIGVLLFGDHLTLALGVGGLMIIAGSFVTVLGERHAEPDGLQAVPAPAP
ncbi:EamA/RhaT family transporter [Caulobacter sp. D5]|uniref:DMT family transporter n=2 Tax=unclassified Caulobacter TaxID=2648921 RepID=UPI000D728264|nr:DMT family transporter [Caulobacter sp. D5]PXA89715.1 EamA/RhaT family transporter [Caulobacter sp. D5]